MDNGKNIKTLLSNYKKLLIILIEVKAREFAEDPVNLQKYGSKEAAMAGWAKDVMGISLNQQTTEHLT